MKAKREYQLIGYNNSEVISKVLFTSKQLRARKFKISDPLSVNCQK